MQSEQCGRYLDMMNQWMILKQEGKSIDSFIRQQKWKSIAVYGMAIYGRHVIRELNETESIVKYGIDRKKLGEYGGVKIIQPTGRLPEVDVIINCVIHEHDAIAGLLQRMVSCPVVSLEDIVFSSY